MVAATYSWSHGVDIYYMYASVSWSSNHSSHNHSTTQCKAFQGVFRQEFKATLNPIDPQSGNIPFVLLLTVCISGSPAPEVAYKSYYCNKLKYRVTTLQTVKNPTFQWLFQTKLQVICRTNAHLY